MIHTLCPPSPSPTGSQTRSQEAPQADRLATVIAQAGSGGISHDRLRRVVGLSRETLQDILKALTATGQVAVVQVNGEVRWRAVG